MPVIPVYTPKTPAPAEKQPQHSPLAQATDTAALRSQLAEAVYREMQKHQTVSSGFLDQFAAGHLTPDTADTPAAWDYAALRRTAEKTEQAQQRQAQQMQLQQAEQWTSQVGELTPDNDTLTAYLDVQLPAYQARLEQSGLPADEAQQRVKQLKTQTVENHIVRSLSGGDWHTAQQVLHAHAEVLPEVSRQRLAQQTRFAFAQDQAKNAWQQALSRYPHQPDFAGAYALSQVQEPDEELQANIRAGIEQLCADYRRKNAKQQAQLFTQLAQADASQRESLLWAQPLLSGEALARTCRAVHHASHAADAGQQHWFVKNYFNPSADVDKAFDKGLCGARDYLLLQAARQNRAGGADNLEDELLCRAIRTFMHKQGFEEKDITQAAYRVLSGAADLAGRQQIWKELKTLLTC